MNKKFKSQASSARAASSTFGGSSLGFGNPASAFQTNASPLSYVTEVPDLSAISDPSIVVAFKNLTKKDSVTKVKALEDLQEVTSSNAETGPEPAVLEAWINIYPRTSIDNARRVRQLAHSLQGSLTVSSGKRIASQLHKVIGAWLSGTFDSDKSVSRAALESFEVAFSSEEKRRAVWRLYQGSLLEYVEDAILRHSPQTLSDERNTTPDDAEAKHVRVVSTALHVLDRLLQIDWGDKALSSNETLQSITNANKTCELASHNDASIRRAVYKLYADAIGQRIELDWKQVSSCFLAKALHVSHTNSSAQYIDALLAITRARPSVWTTEYASKTAVARRLYQYIKQGSQRGPELWWLHLRQLIKIIPAQAWSAVAADSKEGLSYEAANQLLNALHEAIVNTDEPRQNSAAAWATYADIFFWILGTPDVIEEQEKLVQSFLFPVIERYLLAASDLSQWTTPAAISLSLCSSFMLKLEQTFPSTQIAAFYQSMVGCLIETMKTSQPESSKTFKASQDDVIQKTRRFVDLQIAMQTNRTSEEESEGLHHEPRTLALGSTFIQGNIEILREAVKLLRDRNGKPYGAAGAVYLILDKIPGITDEIKISSTPDLLSDLLDQEAPRLLDSPSAELLISILLKCRHMTGFKKSFDAILEQFLQNEALRGSRAYRILLRGITNDDLIHHRDLEQALLQDLNTALAGDDSRWSAVYEIMTNPNLNQSLIAPKPSSTPPIQSRVLEDMLSGLSLDEKEGNALNGFDILLNRNASLRPLLAAHLNLGSLLTRLLLISDSSNEENADKAARLASLVKNMFAKQGEIGRGASAIEIFSRQLDGAGEALSISSLVEIAGEALQDAEKSHSPTVASALFPTVASWQKALTPFLQLQPPLAISLIAPLQGCAFLVDRERRRSSGGLPRDLEGFSVALRLIILVTRLLEQVSPEQLTDDQVEALYLYYPQALQLADDKLSIESANALWIDSTEEVVQEMTDIVAKGQKLIRSWLLDEKSDDTSGTKPTLISCWLSQLSNIHGMSAQSFNLARTFTSVMIEASDLKGASRYIASWEASLRAIRASADTMKSAALLTVCRETLATVALGRRLCNEFVADATEIDFDDANNAIRRLVLLNLLTKGEDDLIGNIPSQRLIFLAKHLISVGSFNQAPTGLQSEILLALTAILPPIRDLYGDFWHGVVTLMAQYLDSIKDASEVVPLHAALRLHACLLSLTGGDSNEDLEEELSKVKPSVDASLLEILTHFDETPSGACQPLEITTALLARQVQNLQFDGQAQIADLYPLLSSEDRSVQGAAYGILHRSLPSIQEQVSIEAALSKTATHLPDELLSLLLDAPSMDLFNNSLYSTDSVWTNIRRYLLSWKVVFDHFSKASHIVQETYVVDIKDYGHLEYLLKFTCDMLRIASGKPMDASKYNITDFTLDAETSLERECQWLTIHLYYLSLLHLPSLTKTWWIEQKNRIKTPLESYSQKHISPLIISASLTSLSEWHSTTTQDNPEEERPLTLKINPRASEAIASIPIDPDSPPIALCITLPPSYPFAHALVTSRNRVAVSEQKWQAWLRTIQGVIMFSNGSVIDGLLAFKKNVQGALKGQSECAICYSVIGSDMKTPDKKCATCKNCFHSACLYRWFRSSNSSSCPLCRNAFHYA
ncbi:hypothetical protein EPUS_08942 [Endocarpon pusillum Z07020]|uniref:E3 ubiquitin-protein ligase listerin n=1 Tax=Endocarpon pusillum (strain Z07020 / HMAS-L-300199) TaxID=1263415 RepID=U1GRB9_ENDPU|nr:uncharacterized protein EPUS_08942 [Endocarpon pusillum Z07020]ERF74531.1 hypothetical protein EPUS_08942 [Endocarpon pusillum Z07020]